jgi:hypothetical protein
MQTIFDDRWIFRIRVVPRNRDWSYELRGSAYRKRTALPSTGVRKPHSSVFGLRQCCNTSPDGSGEFECFRTSPQEDNDLYGRYPERALTIDEEVPYHLRRKVPIQPDWDPSRALAQD